MGLFAQALSKEAVNLENMARNVSCILFVANETYLWATFGVVLDLVRTAFNLFGDP